MTTIIGYNTHNQVIFGADMQRSILDFNGNLKGIESTSVKKIHPLSDKIAIASGGIAEPASSAIDNIKKILDAKEEYDVSTLLEICKDQFSIEYKAFLASKVGLNHTTLYFLLGGICPTSKKAFMYSFRSDQDFEPNEYPPINVVAMGDGFYKSETLKLELESKPEIFHHNKSYLLNEFSKAIRETAISHETTGSETYFLVIKKDNVEERFKNNEGKTI